MLNNIKDIIENHFKDDYHSFYSRYLKNPLKATGNEFKALCIFHDDRNPSLFFNNVKGTFHCFGCGASGDIHSFYAKIKGLDLKLDFPKILEGICQEFGIYNGNGSSKKEQVQSTQKPKVVARYNYNDETENLLFQIERIEPGKKGTKKDFRIRRPDKNGKWIYNKGDVRIIPYHLAEVLKADEILICEGEKDTDNLMKIGFTATTSPFGSGKWPDDFCQYFVGKNIVLVPDSDEPGRLHMKQVANNLKGYASSIKWLNLNGEK